MTDTPDLINRLRAYAAKYGPFDPEYQMCIEAAEAIAGQQDEAREALTKLKPIVEDARYSYEAVGIALRSRWADIVGTLEQ